MRLLILAILSTTAFACGEAAPQAGPCTTCPPVAGHYLETRARQETRCADGSTLYVGAVSRRPVELEQEGSVLRIPSRSMKGVLKTDDSAAFDAFPDYAVNDGTGEHRPGLSYLTGQFGAPDATGKRTFAVTFTFVEDATKCRINAVSEWAPE